MSSASNATKIATTTSYYESLVRGQKIVTVPDFTLDSGATLEQAPVAYSTWGALNKTRDNVLVVCHALTGSSDASDWWQPLMGPGKALDYTRYFIFCANVPGSPYGSASPLSVNPGTEKHYGPLFPETSIRDDVRIHKLVLDSLGVQSVAAVIGGSMGGMHTLEWSLCTPSGYVNNIIPIATSAYQGAWGISWGETQRRVICTDDTFDKGWYNTVPNGQPRRGLGAARMIGMLTYRSCISFEARFGRKPAVTAKRPAKVIGLPTPPLSDIGSTASTTEEPGESPQPSLYFAAQRYLQYQADKFLDRFDANCYIHLTKKMDTHDIARDRDRKYNGDLNPTTANLMESLQAAPSGALVIGVQSDVLFPLDQQALIAQCLPEANFVTLPSSDGHDGFLLEFDLLNELIVKHLKEKCAWLYECPAMHTGIIMEAPTVGSVFGEIESVQC